MSDESGFFFGRPLPRFGISVGFEFDDSEIEDSGVDDFACGDVDAGEVTTVSGEEELVSSSVGGSGLDLGRPS